MTTDEEKRLVGRQAVGHVEDGMTLGLGTGSTVAHFAAALGERIADGLRVRAIPTSDQSRELAERHGIPLIDWEAVESLDLTVDGADEVAADFAIIKGGGGALLHEKIVAAASRRRIYIADASKLVTKLGAFPLPVEVSPFGHSVTARRLEGAGSRASLRMSGEAPLRTSDNNLLYDCACGSIEDPADLHCRLVDIPGVIETGLFIGLVDLLIAVRDGQVAEVTPDQGAWWG